MAKRDSIILQIVTAEKKVEVTSLAERLGVSAVTMRKDLDALQAKGLVIREHGYAMLANPNDVGGRLAYHYDEKLLIARRAAELVPDGATIMVESGSCCALLVRVLADAKQNVTVVTNSAFIASYVRDAANVEVLLLGGTYQRDSQVMVGPLVRTCAQEFYVDRLFVGADGWIDGVGFTNADQMRADAVRCMAESAAEVIVLTESEKFARHSAVPLRLQGKPVTLVTDDGLSGESRHGVEALGVAVLVA
ncbi:MAG: DeoR/GlpR transcriptional regulator [Atopobiaceae bacterium]|nr:DeoR/GlpR transcriptional regulator [Atopobiaceae bacterium]